VPEGTDMADPASLERCEVAFDDSPQATESPFEDPSWNEILRDYAGRLSDTHLTFPTTALACLERFSRMAGGRLLVLTADYGDAREEALLSREPPELRWHGGCFSVGVNFHALGGWCQRHNGELLLPAQRHSSLCIAALLVGLGDSRETRLAYREWIDAVSPDDFFAVKRGLDRAYELLTVQQVVAYLRISGWDVDILRQAMTALVVRAEAASEQEQADLRHALLEVWRQRYPMGDDRTLLHHIAVLLYKMHFYPEALALCESALADFGPHVETYFDMAMALYRLRRLGEALAAANLALALAPDEPGCRALRVRLEGELQRMAP
jgi:tetratricopeptide (TPR) repeat protein